MGGGRQILQLLAGEDIDGDQMDLGVTVLASLGGRHVDDLAGAALDHDVTVLAQGRALHGVGGRRTSVGGLEGHLMLSRALVGGRLMVGCLRFEEERQCLKGGGDVHVALGKRGEVQDAGLVNNPVGRFGERIGEQRRRREFREKGVPRQPW